MRWLAIVPVAMALAGSGVGPALASGVGGPFTMYVDRHGGTPADRTQLSKGRLGVVKTRSPEPLLYLQWRLLNGLKVGEAAGASLFVPCCDQPVSTAPNNGVEGWLAAAGRVKPGKDIPDFLATELPGPDPGWRYMTTPNCFRDAFDTATATLVNRVARFGGGSAAVRAWLATQNAVFAACSSRIAALPPPMADAPAWLKADRAYQEAAFALYQGRNQDAASRFGMIARDASSPWQPKALYLRARAIHRDALAKPGAASFTTARAAIAQLAAAPAGTYGQSETRKMLHSLAYRDQPDKLLAELDRDLHARDPAADLAVSLHDYLSLSERSRQRPEIADWMATLSASQSQPALAHARERWAATKNIAWLVAALAIVGPGDPAARALAADAARVPADNPTWLTAQYHQMRLTFASADPAGLRTRVDAILARDLSRSDRNIFLSLRAQLSTGLADFIRFAVREPLCSDADDYCTGGSWARWDGTLAPGKGPGRYVALGVDVRAIVDRLPLRDRMAVARDRRFPAALRLDLSLTNFGRAVQLQDDAAIDRLAADLAGLLPQLARDWRAIPAQRPGPARRFAEFLILAKIPGMASDLSDYTRPRGSVGQFQGSYQGSWYDWMILPRGATAGPVVVPSAADYIERGYWIVSYNEDDLTCFGQCGTGTFNLQMPRFIAASEKQAMVERAAFVFHGDSENPGPRTFPKGTLSAWEELFSYASAHPRDPRSPEALYWLIRISRWGHHHDRIGYRAFRLLHTRHPGSTWTQRSPYYYD